MSAERRWIGRTQFNYWLLILFAAGCLIATVVVGLLAGLVTSSPGASTAWLTLRRLQPLHTGLALAWLFLGTLGVLGLLTSGEGKGSLIASRAQVALGVSFVAGLVGSVLGGSFSGREYLTWPWHVSVVLGMMFLVTLGLAVSRARRLAAHSQEAAWFILLGLVLIPLSLIEAHLYQMPRIGIAVGRDLAVQWHALDTLIAGWCLLLYGIGFLLLPAGAKPMRMGWWFVLAVIGILFDFGHHNYPSPQLHLVKIVAFSATMLATFSFLKHLRSLRRSQPEPDDLAFGLRHMEIWVLFAVGTGILMAVPWINLYTHGTYFVVGHTMGSIIGVNTLILIVAAGAISGVPSPVRRPLLQWNTAALAVFCGALMLLGLAKGVLRLSHDSLETYHLLLTSYWIIPGAALPLVMTLVGLTADLIRTCLCMLTSLPEDAFLTLGNPEPADHPLTVDPLNLLRSNFECGDDP